MDMYSTQVDGDPGDEEVEEPETGAEPSMPTLTEAEEVPAVTVAAGAVADHLSLAINQSIPEAASAPVTEPQGEPIKQEEKPVVADQADFDALAALASAASLAQTTTGPSPSTPAPSTQQQQQPVKQEQPPAALPVTATVAAQNQASVKNEFDEVSANISFINTIVMFR